MCPTKQGHTIKHLPSTNFFRSRYALVDDDAIQDGSETTSLKDESIELCLWPCFLRHGGFPPKTSSQTAHNARFLEGQPRE